MGINIGICETEAKNASCRELKSNILKVKVEDASKFDNAAEYDHIINLDEAKKAVGDWNAFVMRNKITAETDSIYADKLKNSADIALLQPLSKKTYTGWIDLSKLSADEKKTATDSSKRENRLTSWDMLSFDEMNDMCLKCPLSWDKGRGCIGSFGPDNSMLPEIAKKNGCSIVASAVENAKAGKVLTPADASEVLKEIDILTAALPSEGKMMVRRYSGPLDRLKAVAKISATEGCGFYFF
jgi:hypothetical protein